MALCCLVPSDLPWAEHVWTLTHAPTPARCRQAASIMKKKQIFFLEQVENSDCVYIKSHLGKYLTIDGDGKFLGSGDGQGEEEAMIVEPQADGTWAIKSKKCKDPGHPEPISCSANLVLDLKRALHLHPPG